MELLQDLEQQAATVEEQRRRIDDTASEAARLHAEILWRENELRERQARALLSGTESGPIDGATDALRGRLASLEAILPRMRPHLAAGEAELSAQIAARINARAERVKARATEREQTAFRQIGAALDEFHRVMGTGRALDYLMRYIEDTRHSAILPDPRVRENEQTEAALLALQDERNPEHLVKRFGELLQD